MKENMLMLFIAASLLSCKKENRIDDLKNKITGTWELKTVSCGECLIPSINYSPGNGNKIVLSPDGNFERTKGDTLLFRGSYGLQKSDECNNGASDIAFVSNENPNTLPLFVTVEDSKLILTTPYCYQDGGTSVYMKIR